MSRSEKFLATATCTLSLVILLVLYYSGATMVPIVFAFILAFILDAPVTFLERKGVNRPLSVLAVFLCVFLLLAALGIFFYQSMAAEFRRVELNLGDYVTKLYEFIPAQVKGYLGIETPELLSQRIQQGIEQLQGISLDVYRETFEVVKRAFASTLGFILTILGYFITPVYLYYFLKDLPSIREGFMEIVPPRYREKFLAGSGEVHEILAAFVRGQLSVCAILAVLYSIGLYLIGIDLAVVIGTMAGLLFIIPYLGTVLGIVLSILMALLKFHDVLHPLLCLGWFVAVQALEGSFITPRIVGNRVGLHPVVTIIAIILGGQMFGILGMLLAVPVTAVLNVFIHQLFDFYRVSSYYKGEA